MRSLNFIPLICLFFLLLATLACNYPNADEVQEALELPTPASTIAPSPAPEEVSEPTPITPPDAAEESTAESIPQPTTTSSSYPITIQDNGFKSTYSSMVEASCKLPSIVVLTLRCDGTAELTNTSPSIIDHINCTPGTSDETWYVNGKFDEVTQTVTFENCNFGNFTAQGSFTYSYGAGTLTGEVSCFNKDGEKFVTLFGGD